MNTHSMLLAACLITGCAFEAEQGAIPGDPASESDESIIEIEQEIGGSATVPAPETAAVVKIFSTFGSESGVIWKSWYTTVQGSYVITARHGLTEADELTPSSVTVQFGNQTATGVFVKRYPSTSSNNVDIAMIRTNVALSWNGSKNFTRSFYTGDYSQLWGTALNCYGYGGSSFGTLRWGWFQAQAYAPDTSGADHVLTLLSYPPPYFAYLEPGDSGGPCFNSSSQIVGLIKSSNGTGGGGTSTAMDSAVQQWFMGNQF